MKVRSFIIENRNLFMDILEKELCINGISYVRINNEIHFLDQIIRFYDLEIDKHYIVTNAFAKNIKEHEMKTLTLAEIDINSLLKVKQLEYVPINTYHKIEKNYSTKNYKIQKQESHNVKQLLKKYSK